MKNVSSVSGVWEECHCVTVWLPVCSRARLSWCWRWNRHWRS